MKEKKNNKLLPIIIMVLGFSLIISGVVLLVFDSRFKDNNTGGKESKQETEVAVEYVGDYITKGKFLELAFNEFTLYAIVNTDKELANDPTWKSLAEEFVEWGILDEKSAMEGLNEPVTKEIVVMATINNIYFSKEGNPDEITCKEDCVNKQLIADAVATGLIELENGIFDDEQKMTQKDCESLFEKMHDIDKNSHFDSTGDTYIDTEGYNVIDSYLIDPDSITIIEDSSEE